MRQDMVPTPAKPDLETLCRRWRISELAIFGSALRSDFSPSSDIDVLVTFEPDAPWSYWDWPDMQQDFQRLFGRPIDLVEKRSLANPIRRERILSTARVLYAA